MCRPPNHADMCTSTTLALSACTSHACTDCLSSRSYRSHKLFPPILYRICTGVSCCRIPHCYCTFFPGYMRCADSKYRTCRLCNHKRERYGCMCLHSGIHTSCILPQSSPQDSGTESRLTCCMSPRRDCRNLVCFSLRTVRCSNPLRSINRTCISPCHPPRHHTRHFRHTQEVYHGCSPPPHLAL